MSDFQQNAAFHDALARRYDEYLDTSPHNALARTSFTDLVTSHVQPGRTILDFGCGTGIDALHYARQGYRVLAYDNSPGMVAELSRRGATEIAAGSIVSWSVDYPTFLNELESRMYSDAITADFAVLNSIGDLEPLFAAFARHLAPSGWVIVSLLNPVHWSKIGKPQWWRQFLDPSGGPLPYQTRPYEIYLHRIHSVLRAAKQFDLVGRANAGASVRYEGDQERSWQSADTKRLRRFLWATPMHKLLGHFVFLVLRRNA